MCLSLALKKSKEYIIGYDFGECHVTIFLFPTVMVKELKSYYTF